MLLVTDFERHKYLPRAMNFVDFFLWKTSFLGQTLGDGERAIDIQMRNDQMMIERQFKSNRYRHGFVAPKNE
jgi:hypothetical protein